MTDRVNDDLPPLPEPFDYCYEWDGPFGTRKFSVSQHNGRRPDRSVPLYNADQLRAAVLAERELWDLLDKHGICLSRNYLRDASGRFNGWIACGHGGAFMGKGETMREAALACAAAIRAGTTKSPEPKPGA